jgi:hypothetical protein
MNKWNIGWALVFIFSLAILLGYVIPVALEKSAP